MSKQKRIKRDNTSFEQLPNELFIEIFRSLNGVDIVYAFFTTEQSFSVSIEYLCNYIRF
jgi:hypothetical protein